MKPLLLSTAAILTFALTLVPQAHAQPGSLDITFNPGSGASGSISCMALETNGQIVIGGDFSSFNGTQLSDIARLNSDGSVDTSFYPGVGPNVSLTSVAVQSNGEILIAGGFNTINGVGWNQPALLRTDGSLDTEYNTSRSSGNGTGEISFMMLQPNGKLLICGGFTSVGGTNIYNIARLNTNGTLDITFNPGSALANGGQINAIGFQSTGQIIVGGVFLSFNGVSCNSLVRLNSDGSVDTTFVPQLDNGNVVSLGITHQDQIVIGGGFTSINGYSRNHFARLNADGSLDTTFNPGLGIDGSVSIVSVQNDGKILVAGQFIEPNDTAINGLERFNTNGIVDTTFPTGTGGNSSILAVALQPNGKSLICGGFTQYNGTNINYIARLNGDSSSTTNLEILSPQLYFGMSVAGVVSNTYRIEWTDTLNMPSLWTPLFDVTLGTNPQFIVDPTAPAGNRFYRAVQIAP